MHNIRSNMQYTGNKKEIFWLTLEHTGTGSLYTSMHGGGSRAVDPDPHGSAFISGENVRIKTEQMLRN